MAVELATETQFRFDKVFQRYLLTNQDVWLVLIGSIARSRLDKPLSAIERSAILEAYKQAQPLDVPVSNLALETGVANLGNNQLLRKVCFDYEYELGGSRRLNKAIKDFENGKGQELYPGIRGVSYNEPEHWSFEQWINRDFDDMARSGIIWADTSFNRQTQEPEAVYGLIDRYDDKTRLPWIDRVIQNFFDNEFPSGRAGMGWWRYADLQNAYLEVLPLLGPNELMKAGRNDFYGPLKKPRIISQNTIQ